MNRILKISMLPGTLLIIVATTLFLKVGIGGARAASSQTCGAWSTEFSPNPSTTINEFYGVAANSANDVWAVGYYKSNSTFAELTLIEHWNGSSWSISSSPNTGHGSRLRGVVASSATNAWAVGTYLDSSDVSQALIEQWNGTSWNIVANPAPSWSSELYGVTAFSANNVWAVGDYTSGSGIYQTLVEHWDGTSWSVVPSPNPSADGDSLRSVARVKGTNQVWAVGVEYTRGTQQTLIERWAGTSWKVIASPNPGSEYYELWGVSAISASDIWAVGNYDSTNGQLIEHWNGTSWSVVSSPNVPGSLFAVTALSANNIWAVGYDVNSSETLTEQWNGTSWSVVSSANKGAHSNYLFGVSGISRTGGVWAVGNYTLKNSSNDPDRSLTEFYC